MYNNQNELNLSPEAVASRTHCQDFKKPFQAHAMARYQSLPRFLLLITIVIASTTAVSASSPPQLDQQEEQLDNIIDALIGASDFSNWASLLSSADPSDFPFSATFFIPGDSASSAAAAETRNSILNPFVFSYHIVPQRLTFSDLQLFKNHARLPTLLPNRSILITSNSSTNFSLDDTRLTRPDLYSSASVAVHAVASVLDYSLYGDASASLPKPKTSPPPQQPHGVSGTAAADDPPAVIAVPEPPVIAIYDDSPETDGALSCRFGDPAVILLIACAALMLCFS